MAIVLFLLLFLGGTGFVGVKKVHELADDMYQANVNSMINIAEAKRAVLNERVALLRTIVDPSLTGIRQRIQAESTTEAAAWARYYPAYINANYEREAAEAYISARAKAAPLIEREVALLEAEKTDEVRQFQIQVVGPAIGIVADKMEVLTRINARQAGEAAAYAASTYATTRNLSVAAIAISVAVLLTVATLLACSVLIPLSKARDLAQAIEGGGA